MESFETKIQRAKELLRELNDPQITLQRATECYREGVKLLQEAQKMIEEAKLVVKEVEEGEISERLPK
jgi:exodeoxyribonuclease VII small subunit